MKPKKVYLFVKVNERNKVVWADSCLRFMAISALEFIVKKATSEHGYVDYSLNFKPKSHVTLWSSKFKFFPLCCCYDRMFDEHYFYYGCIEFNVI